MTTEKTLIQKSKDGDFQAFEKLVGLYENMVFNLAYRLTGNYEDAEDILQETFINAFKAIKNFRCEAKFSTWLYRIGYNLCLAKLKNRYDNQSYVDINDGVFDKVQANDLHIRSITPEESIVNKETADEIMASFVEAVAAPSFDQEAINILSSKKNIRLLTFDNLNKVPKFAGDNTEDIFDLKVITGGRVIVQVPYLSKIRNRDRGICTNRHTKE